MHLTTNANFATRNLIIESKRKALKLDFLEFKLVKKTLFNYLQSSYVNKINLGVIESKLEPLLIKLWFMPFKLEKQFFSCSNGILLTKNT